MHTAAIPVTGYSGDRLADLAELGRGRVRRLGESPARMVIVVVADRAGEQRDPPGVTLGTAAWTSSAGQRDSRDWISRITDPDPGRA